MPDEKDTIADEPQAETAVAGQPDEKPPEAGAAAQPDEEPQAETAVTGLPDEKPPEADAAAQPDRCCRATSAHSLAGSSLR